MSNQEILKKAIQKAIDGGWKGSPYLEYERLAGENWRSDMIMGEGIWPVAIVYSPPHDFAKALWGETKHNQPFYGSDGYGPCENCDTTNPDVEYCWQGYLQELVIADDPIKYLEEHINE